MSIVGERGAELFVPGPTWARVMSHESSRAAMAQYSPANESMAAPVAAPMQPIKLETVTINNVEYATVAQVQEYGSAQPVPLQGSKQGCKPGQ